MAMVGVLFAGVSDGSADTVTATWDRNSEPDVSGYVLSYGTESGLYTTSIDVGDVTTRQVNLTPGQWYYFVVQAYNTSGQTSPRSSEVAIDLSVTIIAPVITSLVPLSAAVGTAVTLNGANLGATQGTSTVRFNGTAAIPTSWSATRIVAPVPAGATSGSVVVTVGGLASIGVGFTVVLSNLAPTLTQSADQTSVENAAVSLALIASDLDDATLTYSATGLPPSLSVNATTGVISGTLSAMSAGTYTVNATVSDGSSTDSKSFTWTVRPRAVLADFDGDEKADIAVYRPRRSSWRILNSSTNYSTSLVQRWGSSSSVPVTGDYDGDGRADMANYDPSTGVWSILTSSTDYTAQQSVTLGTSTDLPVAGDYDGDGLTDIGVYQPGTGQWQILMSSTSYTTSFATLWGASDDVPVPADYDGDSMMDLAIYRPSTAQWLILRSSTNYTTSFTITAGSAGDVPVPGDYDGDGKADAAMYRPSDGSWTVIKSTANYTTSLIIPDGTISATPVMADLDGDGKVDLALFLDGDWQVRLSSQGYATSTTISWGRTNDIPLPARP